MKTSPGFPVSRPPGLSQPIPDGHMAALDALGRLAPPSVKSGPDVPGPRCRALDGLHVGLVVIADHRGRDHLGGPQGATEDIPRVEEVKGETLPPQGRS